MPVNFGYVYVLYNSCDMLLHDSRNISLKEMNIIGVLENLLEYKQPLQHIHVMKKNQYYCKLKNFCLSIKNFYLLKIGKSPFNLF